MRTPAHRCVSLRRFALASAVVLLGAAFAAARDPVTAAAPAAGQDLAAAAGLQGGLCVIVGGQPADLASDLARTGRFLVHALHADADAVAAARRALHAAGLYGPASVEQLPNPPRLPYTENLVNLVVCHEATPDGLQGLLSEAARVVCPGGAVLVKAEQAPRAAFERAVLGEPRQLAPHERWWLARKPRPATMDDWTHPRHAADGNPVSRDALVGPPRRVRWVTGPQQEISNMVTSGGRAFYAGVLARDAFNGLKLWEQKLTPTPARGGYGFQAVAGSVRPVAVGDALYVVSDKVLRCLEASTGRQRREYPAAGLPTEVLVSGDTLLAMDRETVRALGTEDGALRWQAAAVEPRYVVADESGVYLLQGPAKAPPQLVALAQSDGAARWRQADYDWLPKVRNLVYYRGLLACEVSTLNDDKPGNVLYVLAAEDGRLLWSREFVPGMTHMKQARAMFVGDLVWLQEEQKCVGLVARTGEVRHGFAVGTGHCYPPVATPHHVFAGELDMTDLETGRLDANRITKGACSRDAGWVPANGLIYAAPKHCICWPMLRDYTALAPARPGGDVLGRLDELRFTPQRGPAAAPNPAPAGDPDAQWPCYRHDAWRSGSTAASVPANLKVLWTAPLGGWPQGTVADDWRGNYFIRGPVGPPVAAGGLVYVTRPDAHEVVALNLADGAVRWRFTANGRVDTAPTIHRGLCLFGSKSGYVYALRADDGQLVWRLQAAPVDERIVAYGQLESPWPVPGSVLVVDDVAYFAAGRQSLADGGILIFAVEPATGQPRWVQRLDSVPQTKFYDSAGLEFDNFDLLQREGDRVAMSRWLIDRQTGSITCDAKSGFAQQATVGGSVMFPRGAWSYAPRNETEHWKERPYLRPLVVFRGNSLFGCTQDRQTVFRRDFDNGSEGFDAEWFKGWDTYARARKGGELWQSQRLAKNTRWTAAPLGNGAAGNGGANGSNEPVAAMILTRAAVFVVGNQGRLAALSPADGKTLAELRVPPIAWDALAAIEGRLVLSTQDGQVVCLGRE